MSYGGEIIVPNVTYIASATAALDRRFGVALVDVDPKTLNIDPDRVEEAIVPGRTRAIMAVHLFGQPADMAALRDIARRHSLVLVEDAAQAHGAIHDMGRVGAIGDVAGFSFQSTKNLRSGEGGALTTNSREIFERAYVLHNAGRSLENPQRWGHETLGWNIRPSEYVAAVLLHRLRTLEKEQSRRHERLMFFREQILPLDCVEPLGVGPGVVRHGAYMFAMRYHPERCRGLSVDEFLAAVQSEAVPLRRGYARTVAQQPAIERLWAKHPQYVRILPTPVADAVVGSLVYLPHHLLLGSKKELARVAAVLRKVETRGTASAARGWAMTNERRSHRNTARADSL
jgi:dTDP-4-amino-4,6-dideoxygalactose transaminase